MNAIPSIDNPTQKLDQLLVQLAGITQELQGLHIDFHGLQTCIDDMDQQQQALNLAVARLEHGLPNGVLPPPHGVLSATTSATAMLAAAATTPCRVLRRDHT